MHKRLVALCAVAVLGSCAPVQQVGAASFSFATAMQSAAQARHVPLPVVQAIAYVNTRWEVVTKPAINGSFLPMSISPSQVDQAAALSGRTAAQVKSDATANLDAGAALLAHSHTSGSNLASWQPAVASLVGPQVAAQVFEALRSGESRTTSTGESITLTPQGIAADSPVPGRAAVAAPTVSSPDYPPAAWVPASTANYSTANRPHDYPVDMIIIHDIEGTAGGAIQWFQNPAAQSSAHYVVSDLGQVTQMVAEHDIAWHAGNWDYNTRAIGIEHEGYASGPSWYTTAMYDASALLSASICSRWGVPMDRAHVIGHFEVPDPNNPGQWGGAGHHTDPGSNWNWTYYMNKAQFDATQLPSPPHMAVDPSAVASGNSATVTWAPAKSCRLPITGYTVVMQPGNVVQSLAASATSATFAGLQSRTIYTFTVTAQNSVGQDSLTTSLGPWAPNESVGGPVGSGPAVASGSSGQMEVFYRGVNGDLLHQAWAGTAWSSPESLGGILTSAPAAVSRGANIVDVFVRGTDLQLWHRARNGTTWGNWEPLGGVLTTGPAVAAWSANRLDVFLRGTDLALWHKAWDGTAWTGWDSLGGILQSGPAVTAWGPYRLDVTAVGTDLQLYERAWSGGWSDWMALGGSMNSAPTISSWAVGRLDVFALTDVRTLQHKFWNGTQWSAWQELRGQQWQGDSASIARSPGNVDVFAVSNNGGLWRISLAF
jgi:N-acetyl-anhydromuramyl-L-alanine amidase AmpD